MSGGFLSRLRAAGLVLALAALVFKAMLPPGFMLEAQSDGVAITLCSGQTIDLGHDQAPGDTSQHCPFAVAATPALDAPQAPALAAPIAVALVFTASPRALQQAPDAIGPPLPARGPPLQA